MASDSGFKPQKEISRIKAQVRKLEREKDKSFPDLGKLTYQVYMEGRLNDPALVEFCGRLKEIDSQVEQANAQIAGLQAQAQQMKESRSAGAPGPLSVCPACGATVTPGLKFCGNCGAMLAQGQPVPPAPAATSCPSCGSPLAPNARFCGECGKLTSQGGPPAAPSPTVPAPPPSPPSAKTTTVTPAAPPVPRELPSPPPVPPPPSAPAPTPPPAPPQISPGAEAPQVKCSSCGAPVDEANAVFCGECGSKLG